MPAKSPNAPVLAQPERGTTPASPSVLMAPSVPGAPKVAPGSAPLKLDLAPLKPGQLPMGPGAGSGSRGALNLMPPPPERKSKLAEDMEKAGKPDCRTAYKDQGLLGAVPLAQSALGKDGGCKW